MRSSKQIQSSELPAVETAGDNIDAQLFTRSVSDAPHVEADDEAAPDWSAIDEEILCPLCEYNLRGLAEARCPECGARYTWRELLDPRTQRHPYLFEHHPEANWWSFWRTLIGGLRPWTFWRSMHPLQRCVRFRLVIHGLAFAFLVLAGMATLNIGQEARGQMLFGGMPFGGAGWGYGTATSTPVAVEAIALALSNLQLRDFQELLASAGLIIAWPIMTLLSLMIFQVSMRRAKVRFNHILRCVLYSADHFALLFPCLGGAIVVQLLLLQWQGHEDNFYGGPNADVVRAAMLIWVACIVLRMVIHAFSERVRSHRVTRMFSIILTAAILVLTPNLFAEPMEFIAAAIAIAFVFGIVRLVIAFNAYLQFHRPMLTVLASQAITILVYANVALFVSTR